MDLLSGKHHYPTRLLLMLVWYSQVAEGARVLVLLLPTYSALTPFLPAMEQLYTKYGHKSVVVTNKDIADAYKNATFDCIVSEKLNEFKFSTGVEKVIESTTKGNKLETWRHVFGLFTRLCETYMSDTVLAERLQKEKFDLAITFNGPGGLCLNIIPYKLSLPFILYGAGQDPINDRLPFLPSFIPNQVLPFSDKMSFTERIINTLVFSLQFIIPDIITPSDALSKYAPEKPYISTSELSRKAELHLIDSDPLLDVPRPLFPNYIYVGGMGAHAAKEITGQLKTFVDSAEHGVVIVSFGSLLKGFPTEVLDTLMAAFQKMSNIKFVFKQDKQTMVVGNVLLMPWIPQNDLLGHHNTKAFITHCGNAGQNEALYHGIPMLGIPFNGDQFNNAKRMESKGYGFTLKLTEITADDVIQSVNTLLTNTKIQSAIKNASIIFRTRPQSPKAVAAYWIDHVIKYGGQYMRPANLDMQFYQYILLDVILFISVIVFVVLSIIVFITKKMYRCICGGKIKTE